MWSCNANNVVIFARSNRLTEILGVLVKHSYILGRLRKLADYVDEIIIQGNSHLPPLPANPVQSQRATPPP